MLRILSVFCVLMFFGSPAQALMAAAPVCTKDAKQCPDGSSVGRVGANCEFALCPGETAPPVGEPGVVEGSSSEGDDGSAAELKPDAIPHPAPKGEEGQGQVMCTMDAKICPDGTGVGRTGPNCAFAPCPGETPSKGQNE